MSDPRASLPAVEIVLSEGALMEALSVWPHALVADAVRAVLASFRERLEVGGSVPSAREVAVAAASRMGGMSRRRLTTVINATGVLLHTNLGRAPLGERAAKRVFEVATAYCNIELDLNSGRRGVRAGFCSELVATLCGAEDALVTSNNAGAVFLSLAALAADREVIVSRGELIEIGGGFRIPEVLALSGARMVEVGTTNRTRVEDYSRAITSRTAAILWVHRSNFTMSGFVSSPEFVELAALASRSALPLVVDVGSGCAFDTARFGLPHEPTPKELIEKGATVVCFSGDKLFGGVQAGVIVGRGAEVARIRRHPFHRAVRADKLVLAVVEEVALSHLRGDDQSLPIVAMLKASVDELKARASTLARAVPGVVVAEVAEMAAAAGGGTMPGSTIPSAGLVLRSWPRGADDLSARLRSGDPPVVARVEDDAVWLDLRTVLPPQDEALGIRLSSL